MENAWFRVNRNDPVTPLLQQWTYQAGTAMVAEGVVAQRVFDIPFPDLLFRVSLEFLKTFDDVA